MIRNLKLGGFCLAVFMILAFTVLPVQAWSEVGYEGCDYHYAVYGTWYENDNDALEGAYLGFWHLDVRFRIDNIDQTADVYKIRVDYDGGDELFPEIIDLYYNWGSDSSYEKAGSFGGPNPSDTQYTIDDATSSTLWIKFYAPHWFLDFVRDTWSFGSEPECWMYWY